MQSVTAVFDIGRTNKKFFLFDEDFREVHREYVSFPMIEDEDGYPAEDIRALHDWLREVFDRILEAKQFDVRAINFSSYGASFVHLDENGEVVAPLYNYTKPFDSKLEAAFYEKFGPELAFAASTGSDRAGMLNSGLQLYWLKHRRPDLFRRIRYSLHLPQYLSYVFTGIPISEYTSVGCHTALWDFKKKDYHDWVYTEEINRLLPPIVSAETSINMDYSGRRIKIGVGIHDSSAALLPYIRSEASPFVLISTGTWSIALNPFTEGALNEADVLGNCINYMRIDGKPVKAARLFLGEEYKGQVKALSEHFGVDEDHHRRVIFDYDIYQRIINDFSPCFAFKNIQRPGQPAATTINTDSFEYAYHQLMVELVEAQADTVIKAIGSSRIEKLFIDGGFSDNDIYVKLLTHRFRELELRTTQSSLGSALGAAIAISDVQLNAMFLTRNYALKKHQPFIVKPADTPPS